MKEKFEQPEVEVIRFEKDDVIATSGGDTTTTGDIGGSGFGNGGSFN